MNAEQLGELVGRNLLSIVLLFSGFIWAYRKFKTKKSKKEVKEDGMV